VQRELAGLADARDEQRDAAHIRTVWFEPASIAHWLMPWMLNVPAAPNRIATPTSRPHVTDANGEERLQRGAAVRLLLPPVPDQHERAETHDLPPEDELHGVLGEDHREHAGAEQRQAREEVGVAAITADVLDGVDLHERRDERHEEQRHDGQAVDVLPEAELRAAALPPRPAADHRLDVRAVVSWRNPRGEPPTARPSA
jgi:hypothetical protein